MRDRNLLFATFCRDVIDEWHKSVVRIILQSCLWWVTGICCSQHSAEWCLMSVRNLMLATFCRVVFDEWQKSVVRIILQSWYWWVTENCCSQHSVEMLLMNDINLLFASFCRVVYDESQESVVRNILQSSFFWVREIFCSQRRKSVVHNILDFLQCWQCWRQRAGALYCRLCNDCLLDTFIVCVDIRHDLTSKPKRVQKPNSWTYNFVEVSGHNLESSRTWGFCLDFLNQRKGIWISTRFSSFLIYSVQ
jgi:hypothetical protein